MLCERATDAAERAIGTSRQLLRLTIAQLPQLGSGETAMRVHPAGRELVEDLLGELGILELVPARRAGSARIRQQILACRNRQQLERAGDRGRTGSWAARTRKSSRNVMTTRTCSSSALASSARANASRSAGSADSVNSSSNWSTNKRAFCLRGNADNRAAIARSSAAISALVIGFPRPAVIAVASASTGEAPGRNVNSIVSSESVENKPGAHERALACTRRAHDREESTRPQAIQQLLEIAFAPEKSEAFTSVNVAKPIYGDVDSSRAVHPVLPRSRSAPNPLGLRARRNPAVRETSHRCGPDRRDRTALSPILGSVGDPDHIAE